jgi:transposase InsO family protein
MLRDRLGVSERWACRTLGQHRCTQRREPTRAGDDLALRAALGKIATDRPRWGYRRAHNELRLDGWELNRKRVQRLWREEGLRVPARSRKRPRREGGADYAARRAAEGKTPREIKRCLKRYVARHLFRVLEATGPSSHTARPQRARTLGICS